MKCPFCGADETQVVDSRVSEEGDSIRRRRRCLACDKRFTTYERVELAMPTIIKRGGGRAEYDRDKLRSSMLLALRKRMGTGDAKDEELPEVDADSLPAITVERSGETREIAGHNTVKHIVRVDEQVFQEVWIAEGLSTAADLDPDKLIKYQQINSRGMIGASSMPYNALYRSPEYRKLLSDGVALETLTHHLAGGFEQRARSIRQVDVDPASVEYRGSITRGTSSPAMASTLDPFRGGA